MSRPRPVRSWRTFAAYGSGSVGSSVYMPKPSISVPRASISSSRSAAKSSRLLTGVTVNSALRMARATGCPRSMRQPASVDSASASRSSSCTNTSRSASVYDSVSCDRSVLIAKAVPVTSTGRSMCALVSLRAKSTSDPTLDARYVSGPGRAKRRSTVDRPGGADACQSRSRCVARSASAAASEISTRPGASATHGDRRLSGPSRRPRHPTVSPPVVCTARPPMPAAAVGFATSIIATGSDQPARAMSALPAGVAKGDFTPPMVSRATEAAYGTTTAFSASSKVGTEASRRANSMDCP